jgi:hypothetical protein
VGRVYTAPALRTTASLLALLWLTASAAAADEWHIGIGPDVFEEAGEAPATRVGGWFDASYEDSDEQPDAGGLNHANLFVDTRWRNLQAFVEGEYERDLDLAGYEEEHQVELEQAYLRWQPSEAFGVRAGRFNTPFGWWVPIHWTILMDSVTPPLYVGKEWVPEQQIGLDFAGRLFPRKLLGPDAEVGWSLFGGYATKGLDQDRTKKFSFGGDLQTRFAQRYRLGVSAYHQKNRKLDDRDELSGVLYGEAGLPFDLTLRSEYVASRRDRVRMGGVRTGLARDAESIYAALRWDAHRLVYLAYRYGYGDDDDEQDLFTTDDRSIHTFTLGILPHRNLRVKLEYSHNEFIDSPRSDFDHWVVSVGGLF